MSNNSLARLYISEPIRADSTLTLTRSQSHYLINVMRMTSGDEFLVFNGIDGEWKVSVTDANKKCTTVSVTEQTLPQKNEPDIWLLFAPIKKDRTDFIIEKATELGVSKIMPVITERTQNSRVNIERLQATAIEATEQSRRLTMPEFEAAQQLQSALNNWPSSRRLIYLDETGNGQALARVLQDKTDDLAFVIGPEGGFSPSELDAMDKLTFSVGADLGPRILRAETAVVAALAIRQAVEDMRK
ncbi:16S rRNA (uracil(1498)-N(3))-methyltransferase [Rhodospirillales bacterium]|jgi:16S rRNA (uracil1498-N3)-methyltransferase|nr:16S rRNA (uracil(1498)-N(3))-methyltransferase [Rhodospirillales bacterium]